MWKRAETSFILFVVNVVHFPFCAVHFLFLTNRFHMNQVPVDCYFYARQKKMQKYNNFIHLYCTANVIFEG